MYPDSILLFKGFMNPDFNVRMLFFLSGIRLWNNLPEVLVTVSSLDAAFKLKAASKEEAVTRTSGEGGIQGGGCDEDFRQIVPQVQTGCTETSLQLNF